MGPVRATEADAARRTAAACEAADEAVAVTAREAAAAAEALQREEDPRVRGAPPRRWR